MRRSIVGRCAALGLLFLAPPAAGQTFTDALELARSNEPTYLSAQANLDASVEKSKQAFAGLLPQVTASANVNSNRRNYLTDDSPIPPATDDYLSRNRQISITQPLWRHQNYVAARQASAVVAQASFQLASAEQELIAKLAAAWCDTMLARDSVLYTSRQVAATKQQWEILRRGAQLGTASAPALEEARAKHEQALSEQVSAEMDLHVKSAVIEQIVGSSTSIRLPFLSSQFKLRELPAESLDRWIEDAERSSPAVLAADQALSAASEEIRKQRAGHAPTLDLVGSYSYTEQPVGNFPGQNGYEIKHSIVGIQLSIPLYSGGGQSAKVGEAVAVRERARHDLEAARRGVRLSTKQAWFLWQAGKARYGAALQAVKSGLLALEAASVGKRSGLRTELDFLQASLQLEGARRDLNKSRYEMIVSLFRFKAAAGQLSDSDIQALEKEFSDREANLTDLMASR